MINPPKNALRFLRWFCREDYLEEIEGDLIEVFKKDFQSSPRQARWRFTWSVLRYLRPKFMKSFKLFENKNKFHMYGNYLTVSRRTLIKNKWYTLINVAGLALGLGSSIFIFLFVSHHLQFDKFHKDSDRVYRIVTEEHRDAIDYTASVPPGLPNAFKGDYPQIEKIAKVVLSENMLISIGSDKKFKQDVDFAEAELFEIFNLPLADGTPVNLRDVNTAVISMEAARKFFGNEDPVGKSFQMNGKDYVTVVGVLKEIPTTTCLRSDVFISFPSLKSHSGFLSGESWGGISSSLECFVRLKPGQNTLDVEEFLATYVKKFRPNSKNVHHYKLQSLADIHFDPRYRGGINPGLLWIFSLIGVFLLTVASINFINISTAQSINRSKEIGVRKVLGSRKSYLFWQFMTETTLVTVLAFTLAVMLVIALLPYFNTVFELSLSTAGLWNIEFIVFACLLLVLIVLMSGSYPSIVLAGTPPLAALKGVAKKTSDGFAVRKVLVVAQFVISMVLIIGTIGVNKQISYASGSDLGFAKSGVVMIPLPVRLPNAQIKSLRDRIAAATGVEKITACFASPGAGYNSWGTNVQFDNRAESEEFEIRAKMGDVNYLDAFDLKLLVGRNFYEKDSVDEVLVNATFAAKARLGSPEEALGKTINIDQGFLKGTIVGVVNDFHDSDFHTAINPIFIAPVREHYYEFAVKINIKNAMEVLGRVETLWTEAFPGQVFEYNFLDQRIDALYKSDHQFLSLTSLFSIIAVFIGCLGIYGLIVFMVAQKTKEIGIRKVLGGGMGHIVFLLSKDFMTLLIIGSIIASPIGWYLIYRWLESYTYKTDINWWIFLAATAFSAVITLATISYQAVKAALTNPVNSLRSE